MPRFSDTLPFACERRIMPEDAQAAFARGQAHFKSKDYAAAEAAFAEAVHLVPQNADYHAWLARSYSAQKNSAQALAQIEQALKLNPRCAMAYFVRGREQKDQDRAIQEYTQAIELDPQYASAYFNRGIAFYGKKDYDRAIQDSTRAIELDPQLAPAYRIRGAAFVGKRYGDLSST
jgi:tetratricopeptide (TPR) repeat protein